MPEGENKGSRSGLGLLLLAALIYIFILTFPILSPIILGFLLVLLFSLALNPLVGGLRRLLGGRTTATMSVIFGLLIVLGLTGWAFYNPVKESAGKFFGRLPDYWERVQKPIIKLEQKAAVSEQKLKREVRSEVISEQSTNATPQEVRSMPPPVAQEPQPSNGLLHSGMAQILGGATSGFKAVASSAATMIMLATTVFVGVIFTLLNPRPMMSFFFSFVPEQHHEKAKRIISQIAAMLPRWAVATLLGMAVIGVMVFLAMWPLLGFQDALVLGLIAFVLEGIPYLGPLLAFLPALLLGIGKGGWTPLWVLAAYAIIQIIENNLIAPVIVAGRLKLQPVAVLFSILLCVTVFGVLGVLLAVPMVAVFNILHRELYRPRFLPNISDAKLEQLARESLETHSQTASANGKKSESSKGDSDKKNTPDDEKK